MLPSLPSWSPSTTPPSTPPQQVVRGSLPSNPVPPVPPSPTSLTALPAALASRLLPTAVSSMFFPVYGASPAAAAAAAAPMPPVRSDSDPPSGLSSTTDDNRSNDRRGRSATRPADSESRGTSRSKSPLALRSLARLVTRVVHTVLPASLEAPLITLRDQIADTTAALQSAYMRGDLLGQHSAQLLAVKQEEEERLERMLRDRDQVLDQTRRELEMLKDQYMAEISKNKALAELYNTSHERRRRVIEELAMVKITLDRVVEEKERLLGVMMAEASKQGPPVPPLPTDADGSTSSPAMASRPLRRSASVSSNKAVRFADQVVTHQQEEEDDGASSEDTELDATRPPGRDSSEAAASTA